MILLIYFLIILSGALQSVTSKLYSRKNDNVFSFNTIKAISALFLFLLISINRYSFHLPTLIYGTAYGLLLCVSMYSGYKALSCGPMSLTSLIVSFSLVIPLFYGIFVCDEKLNSQKIAGLVFVVIAIVFANINKRKISKQKSGSIGWAVYVFFTFASNGFCSILQKKHQTEYSSVYCVEFMLFSMMLCSLVFLILILKSKSLSEVLKSDRKKYAVISGVSNAVAGYGSIKLAGFENASVLFPAISAGTIFFSLVCGVIVFKEKLKYNHFISIICGILAVILLKL